MNTYENSDYTLVYEIKTNVFKTLKKKWKSQA